MPNSPLGCAHAGTEYSPQWMKIPSFASPNHFGSGCRFSESQLASYFDGGPTSPNCAIAMPAGIVARNCLLLIPDCLSQMVMIVME